MAQEDVNIRIKTTADTSGAKAATRSLADMERELQDVKKAFSSAAAGSKEFTSARDKISLLSREIQQVAKSTQGLGRGSNAGGAVLEFSRAFEDAQYGIRGVLNNIPTLVAMLGGGAGLAGVISIAAVAGTQLWEMMSSGAKNSKNPLLDYNNSFKDLVDHFSSIETSARNIRDAAIVKEEDTGAEGLKDNNDSARRSNAANALSSLKERGQISIDMANERVRLAGIEKQLATETGEEALRLTKLREQSIVRIVGYEQGMKNAKDAEALKAADVKIDKASGDLVEKTNIAESKKGESEKLINRKSLLDQKSKELLASRLAEREAEKSKIDQRNASISAVAVDPSYSGLRGAVRSKNEQSKEKIEKLGLPGEQEKASTAEAMMLSKELASLAPDLKSAVEDQADAARLLLQATEEKAGLQETQAAEGINEAGMDMVGIGETIKSAMLQAIQLLRTTPGEGNPLVKEEAAGRIQGLVNDQVPDQEQGPQMAGILQDLSNGLSQKDTALVGGITSIIGMLKTQDGIIKKLIGEIDGLKSQMTVPPR